MKSIHNVIDMLTGIIGDKVTVDDLKVKYKPELTNRSKSPKEIFSGKSGANTPNSDDKEDDMKPAYNFVHYDPEMHWCKTCDIFPKTAKEYLNHLHSNEHKETCMVSRFVAPVAYSISWDNNFFQSSYICLFCVLFSFV